jgi:hypothetical protein
MNTIASTSAPVKSAVALAAEWQRQGWLPGLPPAVSAATFQIDQQIYKHVSCPGCRGRKQDVRPFHKAGEYRLLVACIRCGRGQEG